MNVQQYVISTPALFLSFLLLLMLLSVYLKRKADKTPSGKHAFDPYACGQSKDAVSQYVNPNFRRMFYLAFFFTIMHVLVMIVATAPKGHTLMPVAYIAVGALAMLILFRK
jgi:NADH-quinone oxidoreductase subunit A